MDEDEKKALKEELKADSKQAFDVLADAQKNGWLPEVKIRGTLKEGITIEQALAKMTEIRNQNYLNDRQECGNRYTKPNRYTFGNWGSKVCDNYNIRSMSENTSLTKEQQLENKKKLTELTAQIAHYNSSQIREPTDWQLKDAVIEHTTDKTYCPLAFDDKKNVIYINDETLQNNKNNKYKPVAEAAKGNPVALDGLIYHELNHKHNYDYDGLGRLSYTPVNAAKGDVLTEKISLCTEYLHTVKAYNELKAQGKTTLEYDGKEHNIDELLDMYPGLKEVAEKHGTDINDPATKREIVEAAMNYWDQSRNKTYQKQNDRIMNLGQKTFNLCSFSKQIELLRDEEKTYKEVSTAMLSDINVGGQQIDLKDCRDLIDTYSTEDAKELIAKHNKEDYLKENPVSLPSYQEYEEINRYLESIGKKTDAEKMSYISQTIQTASKSTDSFDKNLENIMLKYNPEITSDIYTIERSDTQIIASAYKTKYDITEFAHTDSAQVQAVPTNSATLLKINQNEK